MGTMRDSVPAETQPSRFEARTRVTIRPVRVKAVITALLIGAAMAAIPCRAQDGSTTSGAVFTNPGARSIGLGGAFVAIADDATAAFANPAGLIQILRPEISIELRGTASKTDTEFDLAHGVSGLGFFSFVYPSRSWAFALYSHQLASVSFDFSINDPLVREFTVRSYATAAAFEISEHLSLGAGFSYFDGDRSPAAGASGFSDADWGLNAGVLWNVSRAWNIAGFYRQGPEFESGGAPTRFSFPDEYGVGVAFQPKAGALTIGFEWDQVGSTTDPLQDGHAVTGSGSEFHFGVEYAVLRWKPVPVFRAGLWRETGRHHDIIATNGAENSFDSEDLGHGAFGVGLAFKRFQIDAGIDISERAVIGSFSFVYSF